MNEIVTKFFSSSAFAVAGVSANRKKFGNIIFRTMKERGLRVYPINPALQEVEGERCFSSVRDLPEDTGALVTVVHPNITETLLDACADRAVSVVWMQPGSDSASVREKARQLDIAIVHGKCLVMYLEPVQSLHALHRWFTKLTGQYTR